MFDVLGLSPAEEALWEALVDRPPVTIGELREVTGANSRTVGATLAGLQTKGLVIRLSGRPARYTATDPNIALDVLILAKEEQLRQARLRTEQYKQRYRSGRRTTAPEDIVEVIRGADAVLQRLYQIHRSAREELCSLQRPPFLTNDNPDEAQKLADGIRWRVVYDTSVLEIPGFLAQIEDWTHQGERARVGTVPVKLLLVDDRIGVISLQHPETTDAILVIHGSSLLVALRNLFESLWDASVPVTVGANATADPTGADPLTQRLLTYLAAGMTDQAIARQIGWHQQSVQRRVRHLMTELGVRTRFQAGLHAARRGWL